MCDPKSPRSVDELIKKSQQLAAEAARLDAQGPDFHKSLMALISEGRELIREITERKSKTDDPN